MAWGCKQTMLVRLRESIHAPNKNLLPSPPVDFQYDFEMNLPCSLFSSEQANQMLDSCSPHSDILGANGEFTGYRLGRVRLCIQERQPSRATWWTSTRADRENMIQYMIDLRTKIQTALDEYELRIADWMQSIWLPAIAEYNLADPGDAMETRISSDEPIKPEAPLTMQESILRTRGRRRHISAKEAA